MRSPYCYLLSIVLIFIFFVAISHSQGFKQSCTLSSVYTGDNALFAAKGQLISMEDFSRPIISDILSLSLGIQSRKARPFFFGLCLAKRFDPNIPKYNVELLDCKFNYGFDKTSVKLIGIHHGLSRDLLRGKTMADSDTSYKSIPRYEPITPIFFKVYFLLGAVVEYFDFEREKARSQKWYISPTVSTGVAAFVHRYNAITMLRCGINHSSLISEIGLKPECIRFL